MKHLSILYGLEYSFKIAFMPLQKIAEYMGEVIRIVCWIIKQCVIGFIIRHLVEGRINYPKAAFMQSFLEVHKYCISLLYLRTIINSKKINIFLKYYYISRQTHTSYVPQLSILILVLYITHNSQLSLGH